MKLHPDSRMTGCFIQYDQNSFLSQVAGASVKRLKGNTSFSTAERADIINSHCMV